MRFGRQNAADAIALAAMAAGVLSLSISLAGRFVLDIDDANLALAVEKFDIRMHQPHPPGYLGYVLFLRLVHFVTRAELLDVPRWSSRLFALGTIYLTFRAALALGADAVRARWAALFAATNPILLYYAVDGQTHAAEAAMSAALVWALAIREPRRRAIACGLLVAAGGSFRPTYLLLASVAIVWAFWRDWRNLILVVSIAIAGTLAWLIPTVILTGGWSAYRAANQALVGELAGRFSVLSSSKDARYVALNLRDTLAWSILALYPLLLIRKGKSQAVYICLAITIPSLLFYFAVICAEAGYLAGLVAPAAVAASLSVVGRGRIFAALLVLTQLGFFLFGPQRIARTFMLPDVAEILERDVRAGFLFDAVHDHLPEEEHFLVLSDFPDMTVLRQFPLIREGTDILFVHDATWFPANGKSWISYATRHGWHAAPGIVLRNDGEDRSLTAKQGYDLVALDPRSSAELRAMLRVQTSCRVDDQNEAEAQMAQEWSPSCFGDSLKFYGLEFHLVGR
jgi:hypothetical protein